MNLLLFVAGLVVVAAGVIGLVVPIVPGVLIVYLGVVLIAWADHFARIGPAMLTLLGVVTAVGLVADNVAGLFGARRAGASGWGVFGAGLGALLGLPFGLPGIVFGPAVGALTLEYLKNSNLRRAARAGVGGLFGFVLGIVAKCVFAFVIIGLAALAYIF